MIITSALGHLGGRAGAEQERAELEKHWPGFSIEQVRKVYLVFHDPYLERLLSGLAQGERAGDVDTIQPNVLLVIGEKARRFSQCEMSE